METGTHKNGLSRLCLLVSLSPSLVLTGCGGDTATVRGKVSFQGRPVIYGSVIFVSADKTAREGVIEADGSYTVKGVHPGEVRIGVASRDPTKGRSTRLGEPSHHKGKAGVAAAKAATKGWFPLPRTLEDPDKSGLSCTV